MEPDRQDNLIDIAGSSDARLAELAHLIAQEQHRRAIESGDVDALIEEGFALGFGPGADTVKDPWVRDGILIAPGGRFDRSASAHRCSFVRVGEGWVWEHGAKLHDDIRRASSKSEMRSVTLVALREGDKIDLVTSKARNGGHQLQQARSFVYTNGTLNLVNSREVRINSHR